jgi:hypothetical protein
VKLFRRADHSRESYAGGFSGREGRSDSANGESGFSTGCSGDHRARLLDPHRYRTVDQSRLAEATKAVEQVMFTRFGEGPVEGETKALIVTTTKPR